LHIARHYADLRTARRLWRRDTSAARGVPHRAPQTRLHRQTRATARAPSGTCATRVVH